MLGSSVVALGCGGRMQGAGDDVDVSTAGAPSSEVAAQEAADGLVQAYDVLCVCEMARSSDGLCDWKAEFPGYNPDAMRESLKRYAAHGGGLAECIRELVRELNECLEGPQACEGSCPNEFALRDDNSVLRELGELCPSQ